MQLNISLRSTIAIFIFIIIAIANNIYLVLNRPFVPQNYFNNWISKYEKRFKDIKNELPVNEIIGYITDENDNPGLNNMNAAQRFYISQYALTPVVLDQTLQHRYIVGNFQNKVNPDYLKRNHLIIVKSYGQGVFLLRNKAL